MSFELKRLNNAVAADTLGFEQLISTQTEIVAGVIETKYYTLLGQSLSDFVPFDVGRGAYSTNIFQYTSAYVGSPFEAGLVQPSSGLGINAKSNIQIDGISVKNNYWRMDYEVSHEIIEMGKVNEQAFSIIEENEKARKKVYDLGMQKIVFLGLDADSKGLLNQSNVTINTSLMPKQFSAMSTAEMQAFASGALAAYLANNNSTALPNRMCMATSDFMSLQTPYSASYPTDLYKIDVLEQAFKKAGCADFKIVHSTYNEKADSTGAKERVVLYNKDADSIKVYIPKPYTPHALYPMNGIDFVSVAEAQFSGVVALRPLEMLYIDVQA